MAGQGTHPNSIAVLTARAEFNEEQAKIRKSAFLTVFRSFLDRDPIEYPNLSRLCKEVSIPWGTLHTWMREDKAFRAEYDAVLEAFDNAVVKSLFDASQHKWGVGYASIWLKLRGKLTERIDHSGTIAHVEFSSNVRQPRTFKSREESLETKPVSA